MYLCVRVARRSVSLSRASVCGRIFSCAFSSVVTRARETTDHARAIARATRRALARARARRHRASARRRRRWDTAREDDDDDVVDGNVITDWEQIVFRRVSRVDASARARDADSRVPRVISRDAHAETMRFQAETKRLLDIVTIRSTPTRRCFFASS